MRAPSFVIIRTKGTGRHRNDHTSSLSGMAIRQAGGVSDATTHGEPRPRSARRGAPRWSAAAPCPPVSR
jgi:hypothetical protein